MRRLLFPALGLLFAAAFFAPRGVCLAGNVLLPGNSSSSGSLVSQPNLGLSAAPTPTPQRKGRANSPKSQNPVLRAPDPNHQTNALTGQFSAFSTRIKDQTDLSAILNRRDKNLPNSLTLSMSKKSYLGAADKVEISNKLGLSNSQIASSCILSVDGQIKTNKGEKEIYGGISSQVSVRFDGAIIGYNLKARALCEVNGSLPTQSGPLTRMNGRFIIPLQPFSCPGPASEVSTLNIIYDGNGKTQCSYE